MGMLFRQWILRGGMGDSPPTSKARRNTLTRRLEDSPVFGSISVEMRSESIPEMLKLKLSLRSTVISFQMSTANPRQSYPGPKLADCDQKGHPKRFEKSYL